jgi:hypothetical protein
VGITFELGISSNFPRRGGDSTITQDLGEKVIFFSSKFECRVLNWIEYHNNIYF